MLRSLVNTPPRLVRSLSTTTAPPPGLQSTLDALQSMDPVSSVSSTAPPLPAPNQAKWGRSHEILSDRSLITVTGTGAVKFLQGLVTADITKFSTSTSTTPVVPTTFLSGKGRVICDTLVWKTSLPDQLLLDVPTETTDDLLAHLSTYVMRRTKVTIADITKDVILTVLYGLPSDVSPPPDSSSVIAAGADPRAPHLGFRIVGREETGVNEELFPTQEGTYQLLRRLSGVPEGDEIRDLTALESNAEIIGGVAFDKGCYLGQELTARSFFKGVIRKRPVPCFFYSPSADVPGEYKVNSRGGVPVMNALEAGAMIWSTQEGVDGAGEVRGGSKVVDLASGKSIGVVVTKPMSGSNLAVVQLRLESILDDFDLDNVAVVELADGSKKEVKLLPFLPEWWPAIDAKTGKAAKE